MQIKFSKFCKKTNMINNKNFILVFFLVYFFLNLNINSAYELEDKYDRANLLIDRHSYKRAISLFMEILKTNSVLDNHKISRIYNNIGYCYYKLDDLESAQNYYLLALKIDHNYVVCLNNVAAVLMNKEKYKESLPYLNKAYELDKNNIKVIFNLFAVNYYLKNKSKAKFYIEKAFKVNENYTTKRLRKNNFSKSKIRKLREYLVKW